MILFNKINQSTTSNKQRLSIDDLCSETLVVAVPENYKKESSPINCDEKSNRSTQAAVVGSYKDDDSNRAFLKREI